MKFPIGGASVDQLWTEGREDCTESKKPQPRKRNVFDSDNYMYNNRGATVESRGDDIHAMHEVRGSTFRVQSVHQRK
jgi:hypothetical protein